MCKARGCQADLAKGVSMHVCIRALLNPTSESDIRQISPKAVLFLTLKICDRSVAQVLGKAKLINWQALGFGCPVQVPASAVTCIKICYDRLRHHEPAVLLICLQGRS